LADVKISALPASTTPLAGTEVLPIVQSSTTRQVSVANLTAGRAVSALSIATTTDATFATTSGTVGIGGASTFDVSPTGSGQYPQLGVWSTSPVIQSTFGFYGGANTTGPSAILLKSRASTVGTNTAVVSGDTLGNLLFRGADGTNYRNAASITSAVDGAVSTGIVPGLLRFQTADSAGTNTERMRITSAGLVGINCSPSYRLQVEGVQNANDIVSRNSTTGGVMDMSINDSYGSVGTKSAHSVVFLTTDTERARIDTSGNLLVGTTTGTGSQLRVHTSGTQCSYMQNSAAAPNGLQIYYSNATPPNSTSNEFLYFSDTSALRMSVRSNGGIANYTANNVVLSDKREKINFAPSKSYLDVICAIPVQTFNYIDQNLETDAGLTLGVTAQDVQAVAPELVTEGNWGSKDQPKMRLEIYQTDLQYALMKALQELKAEFDAYKTTHP
jgi:hypothetical protein